jgi:hypothetical protein
MRWSRFRTWAAAFAVLTIAWWAEQSLAAQLPNPAPGAANELAIVGVAPVNRGAPAADARGRVERLLEVTAGDELRLTLKPAAAREHRYQVRFGAPSGVRAATDPIAPAWITVNGELLTRVPTLDTAGWTERYAYVEQFEPVDPKTPPAGDVDSMGDSAAPVRGVTPRLAPTGTARHHPVPARREPRPEGATAPSASAIDGR